MYKVEFKNGDQKKVASGEEVLLILRQAHNSLMAGCLEDNEIVAKVTTKINHKVFDATSLFVAANKLTCNLFNTHWMNPGEELYDFLGDLAQEITESTGKYVDKVVLGWDDYPFKD